MTGKLFIGRKQELDRLKRLYNKLTPSLVVIKGRRRIGKSRLVDEFVQHQIINQFWSFAGLAPGQGINAQEQRNHFARQLASILKIPPITFLDWDDALAYLSLYIKPGDIILLDEISWMGDSDPTFISKLKTWWDKQKTHLMVVLCGSVSTWIENNILRNTAFFGRINLTITLEPLSILESAEFLRKTGFKGSIYDMYKFLSIVGGIPWYLEQLNVKNTVDNNIKQLAFEKDGLLVLEFDRIFHDLFNGKGATYKKILEALQDGTKTLAEIRSIMKFAHSGTLSSMVEHLIIAGFIQKQPLWSFKTGKLSKQSLYRISDPYIRFYLKVIEPKLIKINLGAFQELNLSAPEFLAHFGLQLEYLLLQNRTLLLKYIGIPIIDVVCDGPYRQSITKTHKGCQIDYLIQTKQNNLYICEFKFRIRELRNEIIEEVESKINVLKTPKNFAPVPVLFHLSGVSDIVATSSYFYRIIDISNFVA